MKRRTPGGIWALRAVTVAVVLVVIIVVASVGYSAYEDYTAVRAELSGGSQQAVGRAVLQGQTETVSINITVPNSGLYTLNVTMTCSYPSSNIVCQRATVNVPPGQQGVLHFRLVVANLAQFTGLSDHRINGTVDISMPPFVSLSVVTDFSGFVSTGGG